MRTGALKERRSKAPWWAAMRAWAGRTAARRDAAAIAAASRRLAVETRRLPGVRTARARVAGTAFRPRVTMTVGCAEEADLAELYTAIEKGPAAHCRALTNKPDLPIIIRFEHI